MNSIVNLVGSPCAEAVVSCASEVPVGKHQY